MSEELSIKIYGTECLRRKSAPVVEITAEHHELVARMEQCMYDESGIGLAAPQVGANIRMFIIDTNIDETLELPSEGEQFLCPRMPVAIFNPEITGADEEDIPFLEGCLSVPGVNATVMRPDHIRLKGQLLDGSSFELDFGGLTSRCIQHEIDHLDGVLFTDKADLKELVKQKKKLLKLERMAKKA